MYLARFEAPAGEILQAALCTRMPPGAEAGRPDLSETLLAGIRVEGSSFALRTQIAEGKVDRLLLLSYPTTARASLEALVQELSSLSGAFLYPCESRDQHDELTAAFPAARQAWMRPGGYRGGGYLLASDFHLFSMVESLFQIALEKRWRLGYQVNVLHQSLQREDLRWLKKQLVRMELQETFPKSLCALQRTIVGRLPETAYLLDEVVGCGGEPEWDFLNRMVDEEFALRMRRYGFSQTPLVEEPADVLRDSIATGFPVETLQESDPVVRAAAAVTSAEIESILSWTPRSKDSHRAGRLPARQPAGALIDVFISYSSPDRECALIVCEGLESRGLPCWIAPRDIEAGISYPEAIMQGLRAAKALVLLFSAHANASPHVAREVERAVSLRVPIVPLRLADVTPTGSLEYLISTAQWLQALDPPRVEDLDDLAKSVSRLIRRA